MPMLKVSNFIEPAAVAGLRSAYDELLAKGAIKPRGTNVTDIDAIRISPESLQLVEAVRARLVSHFPDLPPLSLDYAAYTRATTGGQLALHADAVKEDGSPNHTPWRVVSAVLYLSEQGRDFDGGDISFPGVHEQISPTAGLLIGFTTGWEFRHQVLPVVSGTRDAIIFWYLDENKQRNVPGSMITPAIAQAAIAAAKQPPTHQPIGPHIKLPTPRRIALGTLQPRRKCKWEGAVKENCTSCDPAVAEKNNLYHCDHPEAMQEDCTRGNELSTAHMCWKCVQWEDTSSTILIDQGASGIGDAILGLLAVAGLRAQHPDASILYNCGESAIPFARLFEGPSVVGKQAVPHSAFPVAESRQVNFNYHQEREHGFTTPRWERYRTNIMADRCVIPPLKDPEHVQTLGTQYKDRVLLFPRSHDMNREWPIPHWINLEATLKAAGYKTTVMIPGDDLSAKRVAGLVGPIVAGLPADVLAGAMLNARMVVGNDSGPAHLAGILGVPAIVVGGLLPLEQIYGCYPTVHCLTIGGHSREISPSAVYELISKREPDRTDTVIEPPMGGIEIVNRLHTWAGPKSPDVIFPDAISTIAAKIREAARTCTYDHRPFLHPADADIAFKLTEEFRAGYAAIKWAVSKVLQPKAICEIGVGGGLAALAMLDACPTAAYVGIDSCRYEDDLAVPLLGHVEEQFIALKRHARILRQDSKSLKKLPGEFDLVHVDGDHSFEYARHDLAMAFASGVPWILVDDARDNQVVAGIFTALFALRPGSTEWAMFEDTWTGSILIYTGRNLR